MMDYVYTMYFFTTESSEALRRMGKAGLLRLAKPPTKTATTERGPPKIKENGLSCTGGTRSVASAKGFASASIN